MNLVEHKNTRATNDSVHIRFHKSGLLTISIKMVEKLSLKVGMCIKFYNDADNPQDWYFGINNSGLKLRKHYTGKQLTVNSSSLRKSIVQTKNIKEQSFSLFLGKATRHNGSIIYKLETDQ